MNENILVAKPFSQNPLVGFQPIHDDDEFYGFLSDIIDIRERTAELEVDDSVRQVIPYVLITQRVGQGTHTRVSQVLAAERLTGGNEARLHGSVTLGFGGHVKWDGWPTALEDLLHESIATELREELGVTGWHTPPRLIAAFEDGSNLVGRVHTGLLYEIELSQLIVEDLRSREPDKLATFWTQVDLLPTLEDRLESWARLVYNAYLKNQVGR